MAKTKETVVPAEIKHSKELFISSKKYADVRDALGAILEDGKMYSIKDVDAALEKIMKGKVK